MIQIFYKADHTMSPQVFAQHHLQKNCMTKLIATFFLCSIIGAGKLQAQSLLKEVEDTVPLTEKVTGAFKSTRVINAHSTEMLHKGNLDFRIMHRFGLLNDPYNFFGLDQASMRMGFDYVFKKKPKLIL